MKELDKQLKLLALEAQRHSRKSPQRQRALARLLSAINQSGKLTRPYRGQFQGFYQDIYAEAQQRLFFYICERIDDYDPQREVLQWANFLLKKRFFVEASRDIMPTLPKGLDPKQIKRLTIDDLARNNPVEVEPNWPPCVSEQVVKFIELDPEGIFKNTHVVKNPDANFQFLALKILYGYSWKEISTELGIKVPTLSSFYQRSLAKLAPLIKQYVSD